MKILIIDDESGVRRYLTDLLGRYGHQTESADRAEEAAQQLENRDFDLVISDIEMPGRSGLDFVVDLRRLRPEIPVILTTGSRDPSLASNSRALGARFLEKPYSASQLLEQIDELSAASDRGRSSPTG